ncbi:tubulin-like doman-containing protein [Neobacillus vireti]|uniref:tubulin-like doman-containing protein n=1 Tax=Neobacillus vireti TaxID=220686 RepID=UPI003000441D
MRASVREHIQQLDVSLGGGIVSEKIRVDTIDNPMLVIGLGGTGIDALLRLKYQVNRRFKLSEDPVTKRKAEKPKNIEFLAFETNEAEQNKKYPAENGIGLDPFKEFVLLSNAEIGGLLSDRSKLEPYITDWLSPELSITDGINGASGVRQAGRLLLFTKITDVVRTIERKIGGLLEGTNKKLNVFILTGLSGGTGSGCFLDIAYITRGILERRFGPDGVDRVNMLGYLFTPDVNLSRRGLSTHTEEYIQKNGFAALKELDYWMNCDERKERFQMQYGSHLTVNSPAPPFNLCHLISSTNTEGKLLENAYDYCMNVTAENITNFMANEERGSGEEFAIHDYISNIHTNIAQMDKPFPANYQYNIIGASMAEIPIEEITMYVGYKLFDKMNKMFNSAPDHNDVERFTEKLGMDPDSIHLRFNERVPDALPGYENSDRLSYNNVIKNSIINIEDELEREYLAKAKEQYRRAKIKLPEEMLEEFKKQVKHLFLHPQKGPIYTSRLIFSKDGFCLLKTLDSYINSLNAKLERLPRQIKSENEHAYSKHAEAKSAILSKDRKKNAYIEAKLNEYYAKAEKARIEEMIDFYEELKNLLNNENSKMYEVYREILETLKGIFQKNGDILIKGEEVKKGNNTSYYWNLVSVPDVKKEIQKIFDSKDGDLLIQQWANMLVDKSVNWINETDVDIVGNISEFLTDQFGDLITKSMEDFLRLKHGEDMAIDQIIEQKIAGKLDKDALPVFDLKNPAGQLNFPNWGFVSVPVQAPHIYNGIDNFRKHALHHENFTIKRSELKNRIFWLNTKNGIPLYAYGQLKNYEKSYEKTISEKEGVGRHLVQTDKVNWTYLPSPIPEKSWGQTYFNDRVKKYNDQIRALFDQAREFSIITEKESDKNTNSNFNCHFTKEINISELFARYEVDTKNLDKAAPGNLKPLVRELKELFNGGMEVVESSDIFSSTDLEHAKENFIRSPKLIDKVKEEVKKYSLIKEKIEEVENYLAGQKDKEESLNAFIQAMYTKTIRKRGALYVYDKEIEEDAWEPFVNLMRTTMFVDYEIYLAFQSLGSKHKDQLLRKSELRNNNLISQENATELIAALEEMAATYQKEKESLDYDYKDFVNGEELYGFYKEIMIKVQAMLRQLKS